jgi:hypothetical protein
VLTAEPIQLEEKVETASPDYQANTVSHTNLQKRDVVTSGGTSDNRYIMMKFWKFNIFF